MKVPTDSESVALIRALRPFLSERGQSAADDLLGSVNLISVFDSLGDIVKKRRGMGVQDRPLAFLSGLANLDLDPKIVAKAVENVMEMSSRPPGEQERADKTSALERPKVPRDPLGPRPEDITKMLQNVMARASSDPSFAALLGSLAEEGMRSNMLPKLMETLGADVIPHTDQPERQG